MPQVTIKFHDAELHLITQAIEIAIRVVTHDPTETAMKELQERIDEYLVIKDKIEKPIQF